MESLKNIARITGAGYIIIFITGFFSNFYVLESLFVPGDPVATAGNITANEMLFRSGIAGFLIMVIADLLLAWTLYLLLKPVNEKLSLLAAWFRIVNTALFGLALYNLPEALNTIKSNTSAGDILNSQLMHSFSAFNSTWLIGLVFFGIHLLLLGYLVYKSGYIPALIGLLLVIAGAGYLVDSFAQFLLPAYSNYKDIFMMIVLLPGIIGELSFTLWLLIKGVRVKTKAGEEQ